jgi:putative membrane protein insertion efficiency factor
MSAPMTLPDAAAPPLATMTPPDASRRRRPVRGALIRIIRFYQALRAGRPSPCRYWPTCSAYALDAVERHGASRGSLLAVRRVVRCHPWGGHGVDPVPE